MQRFIKTDMTSPTLHLSTLELAQQLIRIESITPKDAGCQQLLAKKLSALGFHCEHLRFGEGQVAGPVDNLWAVKGTDGPLFCFAGHTDVVPVGNCGAEGKDHERRDQQWAGFTAQKVVPAVLERSRFLHAYWSGAPGKCSKECGNSP